MATNSAPATSWAGRHPLLSTVLALVLVIWVVGAAFGDDEADQGRDSRSSAARDVDAGSDASGEERTDEEGDRRTKSGRGAGAKDIKPKDAGDKNRGSGTTPKPVAVPRPKPKPDPAPRTFLVTRVVDGDTLELGNGETVRLVGMDTPEVGECGFERAAARLGQLVLGQQVRLAVSDEDRDGYGRLLRYVDVGSTDAGLRLISEGLAIARYDSRDGYGYHPREPRYLAADRGSRSVCPKKPVALAAPAPAPAPGGNCAPGYRPCVPPYPPDVDCADVDGPITVTGSDPHALDADGDGTACE